MLFRTIIEPITGRRPISHDNAIVMMGSCFTDNIGQRLVQDGFDVSANAMGVLYNPASIAKVINRALQGYHYSVDDLVEYNGSFHCLDFNTRYQDSDADALVEKLNTDLDRLGERLREASAWIITFGTAYIFELPGGEVVGNCHKLPASRFNRRPMSIDEIVSMWEPLTQEHRIIFTVSPIRHTADTLHGNQLSKSTLLLAINSLTNAEYFPSYEIQLDDLRDYRFYEADMKHPSAVAVDYIYEKFGETYFSSTTVDKAKECRKAYLRSCHRPIID